FQRSSDHAIRFGRMIEGRMSEGRTTDRKRRDTFHAAALVSLVRPRLRQSQAATLPEATPAQASSLLIQPASITTFRLSLRIGTGARKTDLVTLPPGGVKSTTPAMSVNALPPARSEAIEPAALPSSRASCHTETVCVPSATRLSAALSPS